MSPVPGDSGRSSFAAWQLHPNHGVPFVLGMTFARSHVNHACCVLPVYVRMALMKLFVKVMMIQDNLTSYVFAWSV